jgi:glycosyltransferase involved in cell wall biosynthesis
MKLLADDDPQEAAAIAQFRAADPDLKFGPITVLIPSYREAATIANVLREMPKSVEGLPVTTLVVIDGDDDGTSQLARNLGAYACATGGHRGQGAALRLGYRVAVDHGALFLVSMDADGQYLPSEIPLVLGPVLRGEADFSSGSRRLGKDGTPDPVRSFGVDFFAKVISLLTGRRITDPTFGLRAMTADVVRAVTLRQPQYQASELLIGTALQGFRLAERPATINKRRSGKSRKGGNLIYALSFTRVVLGTWWRERRKKRAPPSP